MLSTLNAAVISNTISVSTTDVRSGIAFDNIKATWGKVLGIGDSKANLGAKYDRNANKDFLESVTLSGNAASDDDLTVSYDIEHNFGSKNTELTLSAVSGGTTLSAEYDTDSQLKELSAARELELGDSKVDTEVSWIVKTQNMRVKMMTALGDATVSAQVDYADGDTSGLEFGYASNLEKGRDLTATYSADDKDLEIEIVDTNFESDATWTATANLPTTDGNMVDAATLTLKRSWAW